MTATKTRTRAPRRRPITDSTELTVVTTSGDRITHRCADGWCKTPCGQYWPCLTVQFYAGRRPVNLNPLED